MIKVPTFGLGIPERYRQALFVAATLGLGLYSTAVVVLGLMPVVAPLSPEPHSIIYATCCGLAVLHAYACITADPGWVTRSIGDKSTLNGRTRCHTCNAVRPPRAHHCQHCGRCCLRWDHHCTWMNTCIGRRNYKHYYMLIFFATLAHVYFAALVVAALRGSVNRRVVSASFVMLPTGLISAYLLFWHTLLTVRNLTTVEWVMLHTPRRPLRTRRATDCSDDDADDDEVLPSRHPAASGGYLPRPNTPGSSGAGMPIAHRPRGHVGGTSVKSFAGNTNTAAAANNQPTPESPMGGKGGHLNSACSGNNNIQPSKVQINTTSEAYGANKSGSEDDWAAHATQHNNNGSSSSGNSSPTTSPTAARKVVPLNIMSPNTVRTVWAGVQRGQRQRYTHSASGQQPNGGGRHSTEESPMFGVMITDGCPASGQERASGGGFLSGLRDAFGHNVLVWMLPLPPAFPSACGGSGLMMDAINNIGAAHTGGPCTPTQAPHLHYSP